MRTAVDELTRLEIALLLTGAGTRRRAGAPVGPTRRPTGRRTPTCSTASSRPTVITCAVRPKTWRAGMSVRSSTGTPDTRLCSRRAVAVLARSSVVVLSTSSTVVVSGSAGRATPRPTGSVPRPSAARCPHAATCRRSPDTPVVWTPPPTSPGSTRAATPSWSSRGDRSLPPTARRPECVGPGPGVGALAVRSDAAVDRARSHGAERDHHRSERGAGRGGGRGRRAARWPPGGARSPSDAACWCRSSPPTPRGTRTLLAAGAIAVKDPVELEELLHDLEHVVD